jgi:hypothetical protein
VLPREDPHSLALRDVVHALDLDDPALKDLLATDNRAKYTEVGQARLVITNAVSVDRERSRIAVHPLSISVTDRALICLFDPCPDFQLARLLSAQGDCPGQRWDRCRATDPGQSGDLDLRGCGQLARGGQRCAVRPISA